MGKKFQNWHALSTIKPRSYQEITQIILAHRDKSLPPQRAYEDPCLINLCRTIAEAMKNNKHILLYADFDVDGTMSCVLWIWFFQKIGYTNFDYYIPNRSDDGYGVHLNVLEKFAKKKSTKLVITMDTGITARAEAEWCFENNIIFVATDHHDIQASELPSHGFMLNPKLHHDVIYHTLCGCGVTFILLERFISIHEKIKQVFTQDWFQDAIAITSLATVCDVMPFDGGNRLIVKSGLAAFNSSNRPILACIREQISENNNLIASDYGFKIGPLINSAGRIAHANLIIELFTKFNDPAIIEKKLSELRSLNSQRKSIEKDHLENAEKLLVHLKKESITNKESKKDQASEPIIFLGMENWHQGVLGIVAAKLAEKYNKPTWLYTIKNGMCLGSARSPSYKLINSNNFDLIAAMQSSKHLFDRFGGHKQAAGFRFLQQNTHSLASSLKSYALELQGKYPDLWISKIGYDCEVEINQLTLDLAEHVDSLAPFGHKFEIPIFRITAQIDYYKHYHSKTSGELAHTAIFLKPVTESKIKAVNLKVMFFNDVLNDIAKGQFISCLINVKKSSFRGNDYLDLTGLDYLIMS